MNAAENFLCLNAKCPHNDGVKCIHESSTIIIEDGGKCVAYNHYSGIGLFGRRKPYSKSKGVHMMRLLRQIYDPKSKVNRMYNAQISNNLQK